MNSSSFWVSQNLEKYHRWSIRFAQFHFQKIYSKLKLKSLSHKGFEPSTFRCLLLFVTSCENHSTLRVGRSSQTELMARNLIN